MKTIEDSIKEKLFNELYDKFDLRRGIGVKSEREIFRETLEYVWTEARKIGVCAIL